jgi:hypothetical protein
MRRRHLGLFTDKYRVARVLPVSAQTVAPPVERGDGGRWWQRQGVVRGGGVGIAPSPGGGLMGDVGEISVRVSGCQVGLRR